MNTGEHEQGLKKVIDLIRMIALIILFFHFYFYCYQAFYDWHLTSNISDQLVINIGKTGLLNGFMKSKMIALGLLMLSIPGVKGRKNEKLQYSTAFSWLFAGCIIYFGSYYLFYLCDIQFTKMAIAYMLVTTVGLCWHLPVPVCLQRL